MDTLIVFLLLLAAALIITQRPIRIEVSHKHHTPVVPMKEEPEPEEEDDEEYLPRNMNEVVSNVNELFMGVDYDAEGKER